MLDNTFNSFNNTFNMEEQQTNECQSEILDFMFGIEEEQDEQFGDWHADVAYCNLLEHIMATGEFKEPARQNMKRTKSIFGAMMRFNMSNGFPLLTTKHMFVKGMIAELLWFLKGDTNISYLHNNGVTKFWHEDCYRWFLKNFDKKFPAGTKPMSFEQWKEKLSDASFAKMHGDCGLIYGHQWRAFSGSVDQIANVIKRIFETPADRYKVVSAWNPADMSKQALPACHMLFQFNCRPLSIEHRLTIAIHQNLIDVDFAQGLPDDVVAKQLDSLGIPTQILDLSLTQRSADTCLGVPINIASYSLLLHFIATITHCWPGEFVWFGNDVHIYEHHIEFAKEQCRRNPFALPTLVMHKEHWNMPSKSEWLSNTSKALNKLLDSVKIEDFEFINYQHHDRIPYELCTGLIK